MRAVLLTCDERNITKVPWLEESGIKYEIFLNETTGDAGPKQYNFLTSNRVGALNCFRGHARIWEKYPDENLLIIEDDCYPRPGHDFKKIVNEAESLLNNYTIVSLHGRRAMYSANEHQFNHHNITYSVPAPIVRNVGNAGRTGGKYEGRWVLGSLVYLRCAGLTLPEWNGIPFDLVIANMPSFCVIDETPFLHVESKSIVQTKNQLPPGGKTLTDVTPTVQLPPLRQHGYDRRNVNRGNIIR